MRSDPPVTCGASPLCSKGPLNQVYLCEDNVHFPIGRGRTVFARIFIVGTGVLDCPNRTAAGASPRPTKEVIRL